jgi:type VI protein secretion system component VasK
MQTPRRPGFAWLESLLALGLLLLLFQLFPPLWSCTAYAFDVRNWPRTVWFIANGLVLLGLVAIRFAPDLYQDWRKRKEQGAAERTRKQKHQELREQRAMLDRLRQARSRRIY